MKQRSALIISVGLLLVASGVVLWRLIVEHRFKKVIVAHFERSTQESADFVTYRAYRDAASDLKTGILHFSSLDGWERSLEIGSLKVVVERVPSPDEALRTAGTILGTPPASTLAPGSWPGRSNEWHSVYNWHKSRAAFSQLRKSDKHSAASELLDGLERARVLTHPERLGVESTNVLDPY